MKSSYWIVFLIFSCFFLSHQLDGKILIPSKPSDEFSLLSPLQSHPTLFRFLSFGHLPSAVDALLIKFMTDFEYTHVQPGQKAIQFYSLDLATDIDPLFYSLYTAGANFLAIARNDRESALALIDKGQEFRKNKLGEYSKEFQARYWPFHWRIPLVKGYIHLFEFQDFESAAKAYSELDEYPDVPPVLRKLGERCSKPGGAQEVGIRVLTIMIASEQNDEVKKQLIARRSKLAKERRSLNGT